MEYRLQDLIDMEHFQNLQDRLNKIYAFPSSIVDNDGNILTATAWQDLCAKFHRKNKESEQHCIKSDQYILSHLNEANLAVSYRCPHGLVDNATPIVIDGIHYGNFFTGQFFLEAPDMDFFRTQAEKYGFDEAAYLEAVRKVPIWTQEQLDNYLSFIEGLIAVISESGLKKLKEIETRKKIEETDKRHRSILKTAMDGYWLTDVSGRLLEVNDAYCKMSGYSEEELLAMRIPDLEIVETSELVAEHMQKVILKGSDRFESRHRRKDGTIFEVEISIQFRPEEGGQCVCFLRDITDLKEADRSLRVSEERYRTLFKNMAQGVFYQRADGFLLDYNNAALEMFGLTSDQFMGKTSLDPQWKVIEEDGTALPGDKHPSMVALQTGKPVRDVTVGVYNPRLKTYRWLLVNAIPQFHNVGEKPYQVFVTLQDITDRLAAERAVQISETRLKKAQAMAKVGNWEYDIYTGKIWGSEEAFRIYGIERTSDFLPLHEVESHIIDAKRVNQALADLINQNHTYDIEFHINPKTGKGLTHIHSMADLVCDGDGKPVKVVGVIQDISDYRRMEAKKRQSEETYRNLLNNLNAGVVVHAPDTSIMIANQSACRILGLSEDQIIGKEAIEPNWKFLRDDGSDMPLDEYPVNYVLSTQKTLHNQIVGVVRPSIGDISWVLVNGFPVLNDTGEIEQVIINFVEITEIKQAQQSVIMANKKMRLAADSAHFGVWDLNIKENRLEWDDWMFRLYGIIREDFSGTYKAWQAGIHPDDLARSSQEVAQALSGEKEFNTEFRIVRPDGEVRHIKAHATVSRDSQGDPVHMTGINYDITRQKKSELDLKDSEARFKALHNASFGGIAIHDKGLILECNKGLSEITGYEYSELIGMNGLYLISDNTRETVMRNIEAGYEKPYEVEGVRKNGELYPLRLGARNIPYKGKDVRVVEFRDITENKRAEKERARLEASLRQAQKMEAVGRLAGGVAHDFNNMLSLIIGHVEMAQDQVDPAQPLYAHLAEIKKAGERSANLTRQLLAFARKQTVSPKVLDFNKTVADMISMLKRLIGEDIDLAWIPGQAVWPVKMDPGQIDQILANLCVNARDAIADVGKVTIETGNADLDMEYCADHPGFLPGEYVFLTVSDDGCGMDTETLDKIFEPFFTTKEIGRGTGLGLATVYGVVRQNNGFVNVYSEPGQGTTFKIYVPRHRTKGNFLKAEVTLKSAGRGHEKILLVEDEPAILAMTKMILERFGYQVLAAETPGEAIRLARENVGEIHLLMTDVVMPEMNGRDLAGNILSIYPNLKRLFMSGYTANVIAHHGVLDEGVNFIQKPFSRQELGAKIREVLDKDNMAGNCA